MSLQRQNCSLNVPLVATGSPANGQSAVMPIASSHHEDQELDDQRQQQQSFMRCAHRCAPCCLDHPVLRRSSPCDCCSQFFINHMVLFEDRSIEALYLQHAKGTKRAKIVPPVVIVLACVVTTLVSIVSTFTSIPILILDWYLIGTGDAVVVLVGVVGLAISCAQKCHPRLQYQLRVSALVIAVAVAAVVLPFAILNPYLRFGPISVIGLLWVCQKALVISDAVAARVLVAVVPFNIAVLIGGVVLGISFLSSVAKVSSVTITQTTLELGTSLIACSGVLLWLALRHESASRSLFYWSRVVDANVDTLDAEANPFHKNRLLEWLSQDKPDLEMVAVDRRSSEASRQFWELDGAQLVLKVKVAAGGGGVVWKATYKDKTVAAKQLYANMQTGPEQLQELATEVSVLAQLSHAHIVRFLGLCRHASESSGHDSLYLPLFIVQEYCPTDLRALLTNTLPAMEAVAWQTEVLRLGSEIASAVEYLHRRKVLHRDLKPENVLLTHQHIVRVADFGVSLQFLDGTDSAEDSCGTPAYMPPEMLCGMCEGSSASIEAQADDMASDVYAFGVIVCELVLSNSNVAALDALAENAAMNCELSRIARSATDGDAIERQWLFPPFPWDEDLPVHHYSELGRRCCSFYPTKRPSFAEVCRELSASIVERAGPPRLPQDILVLSESCSKPPTEIEATCGVAASTATESVPLPRLAPATIDVNVGATLEQHKQRAVDKCAWSCWIRHRLRFADGDMEDRFLAFQHSDQFFRYLRWPYVVLAVVQLVFMVVMFATNQPGNAVYPLMSAVLFSTAAVFSWVHRLRRWSMVVLTTVAVAAEVAQCATAWAGIGAPVKVYLNASFTWSWCECGNLSRPVVTCLCTSDSHTLAAVVLPLLHGLATPVILMVLGLPFYLYKWLLAVTAIAWIGTACAGFAAFWSFIIAVYLFDFAIVIVPGLVLFPICAVTAITGERVRRQMFHKLCRLRTQESNLLNRATLRGYRDALIANWRFLEATPGSNERSRTKHTVTAATI